MVTLGVFIQRLKRYTHSVQHDGLHYREILLSSFHMNGHT